MIHELKADRYRARDEHYGSHDEGYRGSFAVYGELIDGKLVVENAMIGTYSYTEFLKALKGPEVPIDVRGSKVPIDADFPGVFNDADEFQNTEVGVRSTMVFMTVLWCVSLFY